MTKISKIIEKIENFAPPDFAADWDNSGWQVFLEDKEINRIIIALSPTIDVIEQAIEKNCSLIISHHPLIFDKIRKINSTNYVQSSIIKAIQNNIQIYCAHTNLDVVKGGVADKLASMLDLKNIIPIEKTDYDTGFGRIGDLEKEEEFDSFIQKLKKVLNADKIKIINPANKTYVKRIALTPGSGGDLIKYLRDVDVYITGDIRYHTALEVDDMIVIDAGHMETERIILETLRELLQESDLEIIIAEEKSPWQII